MFNYELDEPMALYGGIPCTEPHAVATVGVAGSIIGDLVDIEKDEAAARTLISESGVVDPASPARRRDVLRQFTQLVSPCSLHRLGCRYRASLP